MTDWPLIGREAVMVRLSAMLSGHEPASGVVIAGIPGVGKSRVGTECLVLAAAAGHATVRVTATRAASFIPFGVFAPLLPPTLPTTLGSGVHQELLQGATLAIADLGGGRPLALFVDDAHLLDAASATLVHQLATMPNLFVVVAVALGEPAPDAVTALWKDSVVERLDISALSKDDVERLLHAVLGGPVEGRTLRYFQSRSSGNVLFLRHLVLGALDAGVLTCDEGLWRMVDPLPLAASLVELVEARLAGLSSAERTVLEAVAHGEPIGVNLLDQVAEMTHLEALERRSLIVIGREGRRLEARLAHPLHGDVLRARAPNLRADAARRTLAAAIESMGAHRHDDPLRVAVWQLDGGGSVSAQTAVIAAERARALGDYGLAEVLSRRAVEAGAGFDARLLHAEVVGLQGRVEDAEKELTSLEPLVTDTAQRVALALARIQLVGFLQARVGEALKLSEGVLRTVGDHRRDELMATYANLMMSVGDASTAVRLAEPLLREARGRALVEACDAAATGLTRLGRISDALAVSARGAGAHGAELGSSPAWHAAVHVLTECEALCAAGRLLEAEGIAHEHYRRYVVAGQSSAQATASWALARVYLAQGRVASAARWTAEHISLEKQLGSLVLTRWGLIDRAHALGLAGRGADAAGALEEAESLALTGDGRWWPNRLRARAWVAVAQGNQREAVSVLRDMARAAADSREPVPESEALHDLARLGEAPSVAARLGQLATHVEGELAPARAAHARALAAKDPRALRAVATSFEDMGAILLAAEAVTAAASFHQGPGEERQAVADGRRAAALRARCEWAVTPGLSTARAGASLTTREREIATLAVAGLSNRAIAERLQLSVRTVENQLQRVYEKLGVRGRAALATVLDTL